MTIDRAIKREQAKAEEYRAMSSEGNAEIAEIYIRCSKYHEQLSEWLEELKDYRDKNKMVVRVDVENMDSIKDKIDELSKYAGSQYNKAIDDFVKEICKMIVQSENNGNYRFYAVEIKQAIAELAEQLKAGISNET